MNSFMSIRNSEDFTKLSQDNGTRKYGKYLKLPVLRRKLTPVDEMDELGLSVKDERDKKIGIFPNTKDKAPMRNNNPKFRKLSFKDDLDCLNRTNPRDQILEHRNNHIKDIISRNIGKSKENRPILPVNKPFKNNIDTKNRNNLEFIIKTETSIQDKPQIIQSSFKSPRMSSDSIKHFCKASSFKLKTNTRSNSVREFAKGPSTSHSQLKKLREDKGISLDNLNWGEIFQDSTLPLKSRYEKLQLITQKHDSKIRQCEHKRSNCEQITKAYISSIQAKLALLNSFTYKI